MFEQIWPHTRSNEIKYIFVLHLACNIKVGVGFKFNITLIMKYYILKLALSLKIFMRRKSNLIKWIESQWVMQKIVTQSQELTGRGKVQETCRS